MVAGTALGLPNPVVIALYVVLAFGFGYALTMHGVLRAGVDLRRALRVALAADTVSIAVMEVVRGSNRDGIAGARLFTPFEIRVRAMCPALGSEFPV